MIAELLSTYPVSTQMGLLIGGIELVGALASPGTLPSVIVSSFNSLVFKGIKNAYTNIKDAIKEYQVKSHVQTEGEKLFDNFPNAPIPIVNKIVDELTHFPKLKNTFLSGYKLQRDKASKELQHAEYNTPFYNGNEEEHVGNLKLG